MERRLATILFIDLVESTALVSGSDAEVVRRRIGDYFQRAAQAIAAYGGMVEKFVGDAVMAAFGVPQAHEDDAERAVRAAFAVFDSLRELGLEARAGIESGEVLIGEGDATFVTGEAVNVAARLQQSGPAGAIILGPAARRLTEGTVEAVDSGVIAVSARHEVPSWRALGVLDKPRQPARSPFVGRTDELEFLTTLYQRSLGDRRLRLVSVIGEPGVGKSRLVEEFVSSLARATSLRGQALPYGDGVGYWPIASVIKSAAGISDDEPAANAFKLRAAAGNAPVAELLALTLGLSGRQPRPEAGREIAWAISRWVELLARSRPLVLIFDDIHWADPVLLDLIEHLAGAVRSRPVLLICIARPELLEKRPNWPGDRDAARLDIAPLSSAESAQLASGLSEGRAAPALGLLVGRAGGNPLFLEELARMLTEADVDEIDADERIPDTVQALIAARIDLLQPEQKRLLQQAAVVGRVFWRGALAGLTSESELARLLDTLV
jgi:class 3 adenylate cyclase